MQSESCNSGGEPPRIAHADTHHVEDRSLTHPTFDVPHPHAQKSWARRLRWCGAMWAATSIAWRRGGQRTLTNSGRCSTSCWQRWKRGRRAAPCPPRRACFGLKGAHIAPAVSDGVLVHGFPNSWPSQSLQGAHLWLNPCKGPVSLGSLQRGMRHPQERLDEGSCNRGSCWTIK